MQDERDSYHYVEVIEKAGIGSKNSGHQEHVGPRDSDGHSYH